METINAIVGLLFTSALGIGFMLCWPPGWAYWTWIAIKLGSFIMFIFGIFGSFALAAGVLGLWSFFFGIPLWLSQMGGLGTLQSKLTVEGPMVCPVFLALFDEG